MAVFTYEDVIPSLIPNTTMQKRIMDGVPVQYLITPIPGHVLHSGSRDYYEVDPNTQEETLRLGFTRNTASCHVSYDFTPCIVTDHEGNSWTGYGDSGYFAVPESTVPADQIFGGGNNHETA